MSQIIAGIYEIQRQIGSGGGGIVYLGRHLRLEKQVVLKADRRTLDTRPEVLRREVDMLKGLSHRYIPQVYDFVQEDGVVYTVMDFIEGESFDKLLGRGLLPSQPQIIKWACQLLEALSYLHSRPPYGILHGDIKPANIMLRPDGDICLIDYNIALALGENGAVKAGFSRGYASPEHYGADENNQSRNPAVRISNRKTPQVSMTETIKAAETTQTLGKKVPETECAAGHFSSSGVSSKNGGYAVMLDVRSDIYSLGATLYHLLSGHRPAQNAKDVTPLGADVCSPEVAAIIRKAMEPAPDMRFQSAEEMINAFLQLHRSDRRVIRHRRRMAVSAVLLTMVFLIGGICCFTGLKQMEQRQAALTLAEYSADSLAVGNVTDAVNKALQAIPSGRSIFEAPVTSQAQRALTEALGVYDLSDGFKALKTIDLPSAPLKIEISPQGSCLAAVYAYEVALFDLDNQKRLVTLPIQKSALADVLFLNENEILYAGVDGVTAFDLETLSVRWTGEVAATLAVSGNRAIAAAVNTDRDCAVLYRVSDGCIIGEKDFKGRYLPAAANDIFADPGGVVFSLNEDGSMLAASFSDGGLTLFNLENPEEDLIIYEESDYIHFEGGFCGQYFAFAADKSGESIFGLVDIAESVYMNGYSSRNNLLLHADEQGIYLSDGNLLVRFDAQTLEETEMAYTENVNITAFSVDNGYVLAATEDNCFSFYDSGANLMSTESCNENCDFVVLAGNYAVVGNRNEPALRLLKLENHSAAQLLSYDARYPHDEARISQNGQTAMLFSYQGFRIYNMDGELLAEAELPDKEQIYDQQFIKNTDGSWLEVTWYDGAKRCYSAADGFLISEEAGEAPSKDLYEEFYTQQYRIASSLHGAPEVYDLESGRLVAVLEEDAYLTYVTQVENYIITEYISAAGERYGLLLNDNFEVLAYLPGLCDVKEGMLVFDYESGNLRQCRLYSLGELLALGETLK
ncbi:serine/threonine protein kinase [Eisenbergiella massiliensis]|uniref:non-specific serine/threonine protein kinase n=1 Tax=Eisenbergiella massiliensis TaxID=1720294 RepID=A0A3E3I601_9FIRM|nr:WD40 repeat domain-containing serine/threonine protein kinase [Eisenbergiella massiliensis]RGE61006.1 hypothetical protein DXC51_10720 [Eisenbergiella massiliensis]